MITRDNNAIELCKLRMLQVKELRDASQAVLNFATVVWERSTLPEDEGVMI